MTFTRKLLDAAVPVALVCSALIVSPGAASAQGHYPYRLGADSEPRPFVRRRGLSSEADQAVADLKSVGHWNRVCLENISASFEFFGCDPFLQGLNNGFTAPFISEAAWIWGVPRSEWVKDTALVPSLKNITCGNSPCGLFGGYTVSDINENGADDEDAADNSLGFHAAGVQSTQDKSCTDNTNSIGAGNPLLAGSDCPKTWGAEGWKGARKIPQALYLQQFLLDPNNFSFEPTAISDAQLDAAGVPNDTTARIGDFQTYGFTSDYSKDILCGTSVFRSYGNVIPANSPATGGAACNTAAPTRSGWPLGIQVRADAFTFQFPKLKEIAYYQLVFTNKSRDVYNVPLDYDSLYISLNNGWFANGNIQQNPEYVALDKGTEYIVTGPFQPCDNSRAVSDINCARWGGPGVVIGLNQGATAVIMLHSPIGDLRNKLFTRAGNPFFNPANIHAGDTLTYNIHHFCGFRACTRNTFATDPSITPDHEMRAFGMISSIEKYVYGARVAGSFTDQVYWHTFRPFGFPTRCDDTQFPVATPAGCGFSHWVPPGNWDWNHDGILDTLHIDECNTNGCVAAFGDTFPNGKLNGYSNVGGQIAVGPLHLLADSSVSFTFAMTTIQANDAAGLAAQVSAAIDNYMGFYTTPKPAPACRVTAARRFTTGDGVPGAQIVWDNSCFPKAWTDLFLAGQSSAIGAAPPNTPNGNLRVLNPWLADTLNKLATDNLAKLAVFESCDDGATWTSDGSCTAATATPGSEFGDLGFLPREVIPSSDTMPSEFSVVNPLPGHTYTFALVGETRGAIFTVQNGDSVAQNGAPGDTTWYCARNCRAQLDTIEPVLLNALSSSSANPNVARLYIPLSRQAGESRSVAVVTDSVGPMPSSRIGVVPTGDSLAAALYRVTFSDSGHATVLQFHTGKDLDSTRTTLVLLTGAVADTIRGTNIGGLTPSGATVGGPFVSAYAVAGVPHDTTTTTFTWSAGPVMAMAHQGASVTTLSDPLLASSTLLGPSATPAAFHGNADYPKFDMAVDATLRGFASEAFFSDSVKRNVVQPLVLPTVAWSTNSAQYAANTEANGTYRFTWMDYPFGHGDGTGRDEFRLNLANPGASAAQIVSSLTSRKVADSTAVTDSAAAAIATAIARPAFIRDSLVEVSLPFKVRNVSYNRPVLVAMRKRTFSTILVGVVGTNADGSPAPDTIRVTLPGTVWVPGDTLFFIERAGAGGTGAQTVSFTKAIVACDPARFVRVTCNPVYPGTPGADNSGTGGAYLGETPGMLDEVQYFTPVTTASAFSVRAVPPARGAKLDSIPGAVKAGLAAVRVVPNPYILASTYSGVRPNGSTFGQAIMFTHMPPRGVLRIYTISGQFVQQISWTEADLNGNGDLAWNLRTREGNEIGSGLFLYVLTAQDDKGRTLGTKSDKFVIIH